MSSKSYLFLKEFDLNQARKYRFCQLSRFRYYVKETGLHLVKFLNLVEIRQETEQKTSLSKNAKKKQNHKIRSDFWFDTNDKLKRIILETEPLLLKFENLYFREITTQEQNSKLVEEIEDSLIIWTYVKEILKYVILEQKVKGIPIHCDTCDFGVDDYDSEDDDKSSKEEDDNNVENSNEEESDDDDCETFRYIAECGVPPMKPEIDHADPEYQKWRAEGRQTRKEMEQMKKKLFPRVVGAIYDDDF